MTYQEVLAAARTCSGPSCKACPVCNGRACGSTMPGPGAKGTGTVAIRNYEAWQNIDLNMDTICENKPVDTTFRFFGETYALPVFAGPVGAVNLHYGDKYNDLEYNSILVPACVQAGIAAFTGDGTNPDVFTAASAAIGAAGGKGIPTVKPWDKDTLYAKLDAAKASGAKVFAMDIDAAGLPFLKGLTPPAGSKTVAELREIIEYIKVPFILKGIMTVKGAQKALEAGAAGIVVSNHGGRVQDGVPATAQVLPAIADAVKGQMTILVDGGIRTGVDVLKALALGADGVLLARPYVTAVYGGGAEGVQVLTQKLKGELEDTMAMCGVHSLSEIPANTGADSSKQRFFDILRETAKAVSPFFCSLAIFFVPWYHTGIIHFSNRRFFHVSSQSHPGAQSDRTGVHLEHRRPLPHRPGLAGGLLPPGLYFPGLGCGPGGGAGGYQPILRGKPFTSEAPLGIIMCNLQFERGTRKEQPWRTT